MIPGVVPDISYTMFTTPTIILASSSTNSVKEGYKNNVKRIEQTIHL